MQAQVAELLRKLARERKRLRKKKSGEPNESAIARALGVAPSTVHRILHGERHAGDPKAGPRDEYVMSPRLKRGLRKLCGYESEAELLEALQKRRI